MGRGVFIDIEEVGEGFLGHRVKVRGVDWPCDPPSWPPIAWISSQRQLYGGILDNGGSEGGLDGGWSLQVDDGWTHDPCDAYLIHSYELTWINVPQRPWRSSHGSLTWQGPRWCHLASGDTTWHRATCQCCPRPCLSHGMHLVAFLLPYFDNFVPASKILQVQVEPSEI